MCLSYHKVKSLKKNTSSIINQTLITFRQILRYYDKFLEDKKYHNVTRFLLLIIIVNYYNYKIKSKQPRSKLERVM